MSVPDSTTLCDLKRKIQDLEKQMADLEREIAEKNGFFPKQEQRKRVHSFTLFHGSNDPYSSNHQEIRLCVDCPFLAFLIMQKAPEASDDERWQRGFPGHRIQRNVPLNSGFIRINCECGLTLCASEKKYGAVHVPGQTPVQSLRSEYNATVWYELGGPPPPAKK